MIGDDVVAACDETLVDKSQESIRFGGAQDPLQWGAADLRNTLCAALQQEGQQRADHLWTVQLLCAIGKHKKSLASINLLYHASVSTVAQDLHNEVPSKAH